MPRTRAQLAADNGSKRKRRDSDSEASPPSPKRQSPPPEPSLAASTASVESTSTGGSSLAPQEGTAAPVQSSIPGMSIAQIRSILGEQRKLFQENGYVALIDEVCPNMTRLEFDYRYVHGIALKRHQKHKRATGRQKASDT